LAVDGVNFFAGHRLKVPVDLVQEDAHLGFPQHQAPASLSEVAGSQASVEFCASPDGPDTGRDDDTRSINLTASL
ncbi:hypothetical protein AAP84_25375, partial [Salmonella enterica subsp. enterica]|nr:hypothetical protein [Salmonella enterica subsp. enterica serovar Litchfield]